MANIGEYSNYVEGPQTTNYEYDDGLNLSPRFTLSRGDLERMQLEQQQQQIDNDVNVNDENDNNSNDNNVNVDDDNDNDNNTNDDDVNVVNGDDDNASNVESYFSNNPLLDDMEPETITAEPDNEFSHPLPFPVPKKTVQWATQNNPPILPFDTLDDDLNSHNTGSRVQVIVSNSAYRFGSELTHELINKFMNNLFSFDSVCNPAANFIDLTNKPEEECLSALRNATAPVSIKAPRFLSPRVFIAIEKLHGGIEDLYMVDPEQTQQQSSSLWDLQHSIALRMLSKNLTLNGPCTTPTNAQKLMIISPVLNKPLTCSYDPGFFTRLYTLCLSHLELNIETVASLLRTGGRELEIYGCKITRERADFPRIPTFASVSFDSIIDDLDPEIVIWIAQGGPCIKIHRCTLSATLVLPSYVNSLSMTDVGLSSRIAQPLLKISAGSRIESLNVGLFRNNAFIEIDESLRYLAYMNANNVKGLDAFQGHDNLRVMHASNTDMQSLENMRSLIMAHVRGNRVQKLRMANCPSLHHLMLNQVVMGDASNMPNLKHVQLVNGAIFPREFKDANPHIEIQELHFPGM